MKNLIHHLAALALGVAVTTVEVRWGFETPYRDVLQSRTVAPEGPWEDVPGPYGISADGHEYIVGVPTDGEGRVFRVQRDWGLPLLPPAYIARLLGKTDQ